MLILREITTVVKRKLLPLLLFFAIQTIRSQENSLNFFLTSAEKNNPALLQNDNLKKIGNYKNQLIDAENNFQIDVTSEVMLAPYFNNYGKFIDISTNPSPEAYGYAEPVSNGALYSAQLNITKEIFNRARVQDLLFQNRLNNNALELSREEISHQLRKNVTEAYIRVYHLQIKEDYTKDIISDLENRLKVVDLLIKKGILMQSDYLLLQLEIDNKKLELQQLQNNLNATLLSLYNAAGIKTSGRNRLSEPNIPMDTVLQSYLDSISSSTAIRTDSLNERKNSNSVRNTNNIQIDTGYYYLRKLKNDSLQLLAGQEVFEDKYKPHLTAYGNTGMNAVEVDRIPHNVGFSAGLKLNIPIYDGGQRKIKQLQNELELENLEYQKQSELIKKQNTLKSLKQQMASIQTGLNLINAQLKKQEHILEIYKGKMVQGQVSIIDYLKVIEDYKSNVETKDQMKVNLWLLQNEYNFTNW